MSDPSSTPCSYEQVLLLNNRAARRIENGEYDRAISYLLKALEMTNQIGQTSLLEHCALDKCILYSERYRRKAKTSEISHSNDEDGYIYRQPIRVSSDNMGEGLVFVVLFNLALAHHLQALVAHRKHGEQTDLVEKARLLYELAYKWYMKLNCLEDRQDDSSSLLSYPSDGSIRFIIIIQNNLCQLSRLVDNHQTYELYRQYLLSNVMAIIEHDTRVSRQPIMYNMGGLWNNITSLVLGEKACAEAA